MTKRLALRRESLTELTADALQAVVGASIATLHAYTCPIVSGITRAFECEDLTHNC